MLIRAVKLHYMAVTRLSFEFASLMLASFWNFIFAIKKSFCKNFRNFSLLNILHSVFLTFQILIKQTGLKKYIYIKVACDVKTWFAGCHESKCLTKEIAFCKNCRFILEYFLIRVTTKLVVDIALCEKLVTNVNYYSIKFK